MEKVIDNDKLDNIGKIIDILVIELNNGTVIKVDEINHISTTYISEVRYNVMLIKDKDTKVVHKVLLDTNNYIKLLEDLFGTMTVMEPEVLITDEDELSGYSWRLNTKLYANNMK